MKIRSLDAYQIYDSRGNPTIEAEVTLENGMTGRGLVPSGASTGQFEAKELRDGEASRFRGKSVFRAIANVHQKIAAVVRGCDVLDQRAIDDSLIALDGTPDKSHLGANAILAVSLAVANAAAVAKGVPLFQSLGEGTLLPLPEIQIFGGGAHANWRTDVQDFLLIATGAKTYEESLRITFDVYHAAGDLMKERGTCYGVADEGGYWPEFRTNEEVFETFLRAIERAGYTPGVEASLSLDIAASDLFDEASGLYHFRLEDRSFDSDAFAELLTHWCEKYPVVSLEDPMADTDFDGWKKIHSALGSKLQLIGDDLFTTNIARIRQGMESGLANAVLIKLNQIGTVSETMDAIRLTQEAGWNPVVSARSGETEDAFISHLAVATDAGQLKVGSFSRSERMAKWNEVLRISRSLGARARFSPIC
ncbi:MAG: phosphopyruvate hydratase [Chthoniobacterales bacterium]|nr:phosphopyruvate hydratase [Chthoniobacterales bacterium]